MMEYFPMNKPLEEVFEGCLDETTLSAKERGLISFIDETVVSQLSNFKLTLMAKFLRTNDLFDLEIPTQNVMTMKDMLPIVIGSILSDFETVANQNWVNNTIASWGKNHLTKKTVIRAYPLISTNQHMDYHPYLETKKGKEKYLQEVKNAESIQKNIYQKMEREFDIILKSLIENYPEIDIHKAVLINLTNVARKNSIGDFFNNNYYLILEMEADSKE